MQTQLAQIAVKLREIAIIIEEGPPQPTTPWINEVDKMPINHHPNNGDFVRNFGHDAFWPTRTKNPTGITIHHATSNSKIGTANYCTNNVWGRGYPCISYHFWVPSTDDCTPYQLAKIEWMLWHDHTGKYSHNISVAMAGHLHLHQPPQEQIEATVNLCKYLMDTYNIPIDNVTGHRERYRMQTQCPGWGQPDDPVSAGTGWKADFFSSLHAA